MEIKDAYKQKIAQLKSLAIFLESLESMNLANFVKAKYSFNFPPTQVVSEDLRGKILEELMKAQKLRVELSLSRLENCSSDPMSRDWILYLRNLPLENVKG